MVTHIKFVGLPPELHGVVENRALKDKKDKEPEKPEDYTKFKYNKKSHLLKFERMIDPVIISMFYGLYISKKLPEKNESVTNYEKKEFGIVNISQYWELFSHLLFCLWIKINGYPNESTNILYRTNLYKFIKCLLNEDYFINTIIPFYLNEANKNDMGYAFLYNMKESGFIEFKSSTSSPEYLAMEFQTAQKEFEDDIIKPLFEKITPSVEMNIDEDNFISEFKKYIDGGETGYTEFKSSALWSKHLNSEQIRDSTSNEVRNFGKDASNYIIARSIASFFNTDGGNLIIGIKENKETGNDEIIGITSEFNKLRDKNIDGYRRMIIDDIVRKYFEDDIHNNATKYITMIFPEIEGKTMCWLQIKRADKRVFVKTKQNGDMFFIRTDAETREITGQELVDYCERRFK